MLFLASIGRWRSEVETQGDQCNYEDPVNISSCCLIGVVCNGQLPHEVLSV